MKKIVIASACRTAIGKFGGTLANVPAVELGSIRCYHSRSSGSRNGKQQPERRRFACSGRLSGRKQ